MNTITKIAYNCRKATFLIEKRQIGKITLKEKLELKIHLAGCAVCRLFQQQSMLINRMVSNHFNHTEKEGLLLDEDFKKSLQQKIKEELGRS